MLNSLSNDFEEELGVQQLNIGLLNVDDSSWLGNDSLCRDTGVILVCLSLFLVIFANAIKEIHSGGGELEMLNTDVDSLGDDAVAYLFVDNDSNCARIDVEDSAGTAVVVLVRHTFVDGTIDGDVHDISVLVGGQ